MLLPMAHVAVRMGASAESRDYGITLLGVPQAAGSLNHSSCKVPRILGLPAVGRHKQGMLQNRTPTTILSVRAERGEPILAPAYCSGLLDLVSSNSLDRLACSPPGPSRKCGTVFSPARQTSQVQHLL